MTLYFNTWKSLGGGTLETRETFVGDIIKEAQRFKHRKLVQQLEEWKTNLKTGFNGSHLNNKLMDNEWAGVDHIPFISNDPFQL